MLTRLRAFVLPLVITSLCASAGFTGVAQKKDDGKAAQEKDKMDQGQRQDTQALIQGVDAAMAAPQPPVSDIKIAWHNDFLKALESKTYVPFILTIDPGAMKSPVALYLRVVQRGTTAPPAPAAAPAAAPGKKDDRKAPPKDDRPVYPFEDLHFLDLKPGAPGEPVRISRAFAVPPGDYDVYVAMKERAPAAGTGVAGTAATAAPRTAVLKQAVSVPNFWSGELTTSSLILADKVQPATASLTKDQQADHPYALGSTEIVPALDATFKKSEELNVIFLVYNPGLNAEKKPDVTVEYSFHQKTGDVEKYFNKTQPQDFNAQSLPPQFDLAAGHQLVAGQSVPLASFPEGEYRLEIKITDKITQKTLSREVRFTVAGA